MRHIIPYMYFIKQVGNIKIPLWFVNYKKHKTNVYKNNKFFIKSYNFLCLVVSPSKYPLYVFFYTIHWSKALNVNPLVFKLHEITIFSDQCFLSRFTSPKLAGFDGDIETLYFIGSIRNVVSKRMLVINKQKHETCM